MTAMAMLRSCAAWDASSVDEKRELALQVATAFDSRVRADGLETHALGGQEHTVALFIADGARFALLPGYIGPLGCDDAKLSVLETRLGEGIEGASAGDRTSGKRLRGVLTPPRHVSLRPFLMEIAPVPLEERDQLADGRWVGSGNPVRRLDVAARVTRGGFRLPTSDEWEYACSGGARTLFRWGDDWPPMHWTPEAKRMPGEWRVDLKPNAFGLLIGRDPYDLEYCAESAVLRGGDGGAAASSGAGLLQEWLPLASAYCFPFSERFVSLLRRPFLRRALSLPAAIADLS